MKKQLLFLFLLCTLFATVTHAQCDGNVFFADMNFKNVLLANSAINTDGNNEISCVEAENYTGGIAVEVKTISDLTGIEAFVNITTLACGRNRLTALDVSQNTKLVKLSCFRNELTALDVTNNPELISLNFTSNQISSIDVSQNTKLEMLSGSSNQISVFDVNNNRNLKTLSVSFNPLTKINVSQNLKLTDLRCRYNQLTAINVSNNTALINLFCDGNQLRHIDLSQNTKLRDLLCGDNVLENLDVSNNPELESLFCYENSLKSIDVSHNPELYTLQCDYNQIKGIDVSHNPKLETLYCDSNQLASLNTKNGTRSITELFAFDNPFLSCIQVDDAKAANNGEGNYEDWYVDDEVVYAENCAGQNSITAKKGQHTKKDESSILLETNTSLFPNPASYQLTITKNNNVGQLDVYLTNIDGTLVRTILIPRESNTLSLPVHDLDKGLYLIQLKSVHKTTTKKVWIQ